MAAAREHGCLPGEAIAGELGGRYARVRGNTTAAIAFLTRARTCYEQWGAARKVERLDRVLADLSGPRLDALDLIARLDALQGRYDLLHAAIAALPVSAVVLDPDRTVVAGSGSVDGPAKPLYDSDGRLLGYVIVRN
jgi:hypothetical protein